MKKARIAAVLLLGIILLSGLACDIESTGSEPTSGDAEVRIDSETLDCETMGDYYDCDITGTVTNVGDGDAGLVMVEADFFSSSGIKIESGASYIGDLKAGGSAYYSVTFFDKKFPYDYDIWVEWYDY